MARTIDSKLVKDAVWNSNYWKRDNKPDKVFVHHMVAKDWTAKRCGQFFQGAGVSSNYGIGVKGDICQYVEESKGAWAQGSTYWNKRGISIEIANSTGNPTWMISDESLESCIELVADIFKRNELGLVNYNGTTKGNLLMHKWVANTSCPGLYLGNKFQYIADESNKIILGVVRVHARGYFKYGDKGRSVRLIQRFLRSQGLYKGQYKGEIGTYLTVTKSAVKKFQKKYKLTVDGLWGPECEKKYKELMK